MVKRFIDILNEQHEEIKSLKKENGQLKSYTGEMEDYLARLEEKSEQLKKENLDLSEELDYYKTKCASLENGLLQSQKDVGWLILFGNKCLQIERQLQKQNLRDDMDD